MLTPKQIETFQRAAEYGCGRVLTFRGDRLDAMRHGIALALHYIAPMVTAIEPPAPKSEPEEPAK
jgi:hypothetical protein